MENILLNLSLEDDILMPQNVLLEPFLRRNSFGPYACLAF